VLKSAKGTGDRGKEEESSEWRDCPKIIGKGKRLPKEEDLQMYRFTKVGKHRRGPVKLLEGEKDSHWVWRAPLI